MEDAAISSSRRGNVIAWVSLLLASLTFALAVCSNIARSLGFVLATGICFLLCILLGVIANIQISRRGEPRVGVRRAEMAIVIATLALLPIFVGLAQSVRWVTIRARGLNNLKYLGLAMDAYEVEHGHLPPAAIRDKNGLPLLSWRVLLLPYLEHEELYNQFHLNEPWNSSHNKALLERMPHVYAPELGNPTGEPNTTFYQVFAGKGTAFDGEERALQKIHGATAAANTILVVEAGRSVPWTKPVDLYYSKERPLPPLGDFYKNEYYLTPRGRFLALFADGSVRCFYHDTPEALLRPLLTWDGGMEVDWNKLEPWCRGLRADPRILGP